MSQAVAKAITNKLVVNLHRFRFFKYCHKLIAGTFCLLFCYTAAAQSGNLVFRHITKNDACPRLI
jgi:hypothetical protein